MPFFSSLLQEKKLPEVFVSYEKFAGSLIILQFLSAFFQFKFIFSKHA